nr:hypothetical protein [Tanacetum cinerariifolium]
MWVQGFVGNRQLRILIDSTEKVEELSGKHSKGGIISDQLVFVKGDSIGILKEYITKHNVPNDVPDDAEILSEDDDGETENPKKKKASLEEKSQEMWKREFLTGRKM